MAGLIKNHFEEEVMTELSWIMRAIDTLCEKIGVESYEITLIKHRIQPEEEAAISYFLGHHARQLNTYSLNDMRQLIAKHFIETTNKPWTLSDDKLEQVIESWKKQYGSGFGLYEK